MPVFPDTPANGCPGCHRGNNEQYPPDFEEEPHAQPDQVAAGGNDDSRLEKIPDPPAGAAPVVMRQMGRTDAASCRLFPTVDRSVRLFAKIAAGMAVILSAILVGVTVCFLGKREKLYRHVLFVQLSVHL